jgi:para-aminobenzoate synthetase/4-amino-4-deoxychorismate lyase
MLKTRNGYAGDIDLFRPIIAGQMSQPTATTQRPRPELRHGVIETFLIVDDAPVELDAHLARLADSVQALYGEEPPDTRELVVSRARGGGLGRMRLTVEPLRDGGFEFYVVVASVEPDSVFPTRELAANLFTMTVDRGMGAHKWADRAVLERAEAMGPPGGVPLLVSEAGEALEASRGNLFAVRDGRLLTPPLDGRILPGIARARVIELAEGLGIEVGEEPIGLSEMRGFEEVFLTGSVRGVEPVGALDGEDLQVGDEITARLAAALRERWFGASA